MLYREIIAVYSQIHTKHINTLCGQNVAFHIVKAERSQSNHRTLQVRIIYTGYVTYTNFLIVRQVKSA